MYFISYIRYIFIIISMFFVFTTELKLPLDSSIRLCFRINNNIELNLKEFWQLKRRAPIMRVDKLNIDWEWGETRITNSYICRFPHYGRETRVRVSRVRSLRKLYLPPGSCESTIIRYNLLSRYDL